GGVLPAAAGPVPVGAATADLRALLRGGSPAAVRAYVDGLPADVVHALVQACPALLGAADGVPAPVRYTANRVVISRALARARSDGDSSLARRLDEWMRPGRQFLLVDLAGGRVAEVFGDLATAAHVAVVVPGILNDPGNFDTDLSSDARHLHRQTCRSAPGQVATIAWLGYRTPTVITSPFDDAAAVAAGDLRDLVVGLLLRSGVTTTVVAHSYGSLVAARALQLGLRVDAVVVLGSPGLGARTATGLEVPAGTRLYAARAPGDVVALSENFGRDPTDPRFGIPRITTGDPRAGGPAGHGDYLRGESECLRNLARIVSGDYAEVTTVRPGRLERAVALPSQVSDVAGAGSVAVHVAERGMAARLPAPLRRPAEDIVEAQERADHLIRRMRDPDLYVDITGDIADLSRTSGCPPSDPTGPS
ncbi:MAG: alpha/beta hydrolase, partial [Mycobacteriales bacterium]